MKSFFLYFFLSMIVHGLLFVDSPSLLIESRKIHFAKKNLGKTSIKIRLALDEPVPIKNKNLIAKSKKNLKKKKKFRKLIKGNDSLRDKKINSGETEVLNQYLDKIRRLIAAQKVKSRMATRLNLKGSVKISFIIVRPGSIKGIQVVKSSGQMILDNSALSSVKNIAEIPIMPSAITMKEIPLSLEILYD